MIIVMIMIILIMIAPMIMIMIEVIRRRESKEAKEKATIDKKKKQLRLLAAEVVKIREEMEEPQFKLLKRHLEKLVRWKSRKGDEKLPSKKKEGLQKSWNKIKDWESPHVSPCCSGDELDADDQSEEGEGVDDAVDEMDSD